MPSLSFEKGGQQVVNDAISTVSIYCQVNDMRWPACSLDLDWLDRKRSWLTLSRYPRIWEPWSAWSRIVDVLSKFENATLQIQDRRVTCWASSIDWWPWSGYWDVNSMSHWPNTAHDADILKFLCSGTLRSRSHLISLPLVLGFIMEDRFSLYYQLLYFIHRLQLADDIEMNAAHVWLL
jgi:hypothetical protein